MNSSRDEDIFMDLVQVNESATSRKGQNYKKPIEPFLKYDDQEFFEHYRFNKPTVRYIAEIVRKELAPWTNRGGALSVGTTVFVAIRYLGKGYYQSDVGKVKRRKQMKQQIGSVCQDLSSVNATCVAIVL